MLCLYQWSLTGVKDRQSSRGGGVFLMVKKTPYITVHQVPLWSKYDHVELICVELSDNTDSLPFRVIVVYRPPGYNTDDNTLLFSALNDLADNCARLCVLGDFNMPNFNWD